uniref:S-formylglutathione hydrolase n=1 Tax=Panagrolaimus sp. PS1159 TaxID=55785 RepID=A0AC35G8P2_9BILA
MPAIELKEVSSVKCFGGFQKVFEFYSNELKSNTKFGVYLPENIQDQKLPALFYLSGLTCTEANFVEKSGFQRYAAEHKIIVINPDTSPRGVKIEGDDESYDFGTGAGFYLDATVPKWAENYRMYSYIVKELTQLVFSKLPVDQKRVGIFGHSMGGHGALSIGLKHPEIFRSISAFAPICNPINCQWGQKAFTGYLGDDQTKWKQYDSTEIAKGYNGPEREILLDQGTADKFYHEKQLLPENFVDVQNSKIKVHLEKREGYDHGYFYISTFMGDHFKFHSKHL